MNTPVFLHTVDSCTFGQCTLSLLCTLLRPISCHCKLHLDSHGPQQPSIFLLKWLKGRAVKNNRKIFLLPSNPCIYMLRNWKGTEETKPSHVEPQNSTLLITYTETVPMENISICVRDFLWRFEQPYKRYIYQEKIL